MQTYSDIKSIFATLIANRAIVTKRGNVEALLDFTPRSLDLVQAWDEAKPSLDTEWKKKMTAFTDDEWATFRDDVDGMVSQRIKLLISIGENHEHEKPQ